MSTPLSDYIKVTHGYAFPGDGFTEEPTGDLILTPGNFAIGGGFQMGRGKYFIGDVPSEYVLPPGVLVVTMTDLSKESDTLGYPAIVPSIPGLRILHNQRIGRVVFKRDDELNKRFLYYVMCTRSYRHEILASATGTGVKHTAPSRIEAFRFDFPPVSEQRAIAEILGSLDDKIDLNRRMNATLEALAAAIFKAWFVDFEPVKARAAGSRSFPGMPQDVFDALPDSFEDSAIGPVPKGWGVKPIGEVVSVKGGGTPSTAQPGFWDGGTHHWATPKDMSGLASPVLLTTERRITDAGLERVSSGLLPRGTVLLSSRAPIGYLAIADVSTAVNQGMIAMVCDGPLPPPYVLQWCVFNMEEIKGRANGTTFQEVSKANFRPIPALVPPHALLAAFRSIVDPLYALITANLRESVTLAATRDLLLPRLLSGKLAPGDPARLLEVAD
jgi:type I restriction enzyme, S subunit